MGKFKDLHVTVLEMLENGTNFEEVAAFIMTVLPGCQYDEALSIIMEAEAVIDGLVFDSNYDSNNDSNYDSNYDDSMDGDHASALASVGWGTDEDYGFSSDDY